MMMRRFRFALLILVAVCLPLAATAAQERGVPQSRQEIELSFAPLVKRVAPAVVNIYTRKVIRRRQQTPLFDDPFFQRFFGQGFGLGQPRERIQNALGSGVIVKPNGLIVTNGHVIEGADQVTVVLSDQREFEAKVVEVDERTDLAVLRIDTKGEALPYLELGDSDKLEVGDLVLAIGNPFGVGQTVTSGIVSALGRTEPGLSDLNAFIQTDAAINPGNSGGALVTMNGRLAGVNTAIFSKTGASHGIGFAIPSNMVRFVLAGVAKGGTLVRPWLGAWGQAVTNELAQSLGRRRPGGVLVNRVYKGGPADRAGLRVGDVILGVDHHEVANPEALRFRIGTLSVGGTADLTVWRRGHGRTLTVSLVKPPEVPPRNVTPLKGRTPLSGAVVANMSPALAEELGVRSFKPGVVIIKMRSGSIAARLGFKPEDRITIVNGRKIDRVDTLRKALSGAQNGWRLTIDRKGRSISVAFNQ